MTSLDTVPEIEGAARDGMFVRHEDAPVLPPPPRSTGVVGWLRANLFSSPLNTILTLVGLWFVWTSVSALVEFAILDAVWTGENREACLGPDVGACWAFIDARLPQFIYGRFPIEERWRADIVFFLLAASLIPLAIPKVPFKRVNAIFFLAVFPFVSLILLSGGNFDVGFGWWLALVVGLAVTEFVIFLPVILGEPMTRERIRAGIGALVPFGYLAVVLIALSIDFGLVPVETALWGGLLVTLIVAITGIVASLPLGILLALGRRSRLPIIRGLSVAFIEFWRGIPLITVLFMSSVMLPLFLPSDVTFDKLLRALVGVALFASAYMAEVVRGGLQAIPKGQYEAAAAMGLSQAQAMRLIILPQALKHVIPGIMNSFIALFKDTSLVLIIGIFDLVGIVRISMQDPNWATPVTVTTGWLFVAIVFFCFCYTMSRYSLFIERRLETGRR